MRVLDPCFLGGWLIDLSSLISWEAMLGESISTVSSGLDGWLICDVGRAHFNLFVLDLSLVVDWPIGGLAPPWMPSRESILTVSSGHFLGDDWSISRLSPRMRCRERSFQLLVLELSWVVHWLISRLSPPRMPRRKRAFHLLVLDLSLVVDLIA